MGELVLASSNSGADLFFSLGVQKLFMRFFTDIRTLLKKIKLS